MSERTLQDEHHWSGWPGAFCLKCFAPDPMEIALADGLWTPDLENDTIEWIGTDEQKKAAEAANVCPVKGVLKWNEETKKWDLVNMTFNERLREANRKRLPLFKNRKGEPAHSMPDGSDWKLATWLNAVLGEVGEAANIIKKIERGDFSLEEGREELGKELADVAIYLDITAFRFGIAFLVTIDRQAPLAAMPPGSKLSMLFPTVAKSIWFLTEMGLQNDINNIAIDRIKANTHIQSLYITLFHLAYYAGIDLEAAITAKFNEVSDRVGCEVKL